MAARSALPIRSCCTTCTARRRRSPTSSRAFGCDEVVPGIGRTGVVGVIRGRKGKTGGKVIGLRADMDALPIEEETGLPYKSTVPGKMHACGHDGHTAMLLGAAQYLAETRNFAGTAVVIFQPAEEGGAGGKAMVKDGLMDALRHRRSLRHAQLSRACRSANSPSAPGPIMAAADHIAIDIEGKGGHAARPHLSIDTVLVGAQIVNKLQSIVARNVDPLEAAVVSICMFQAGNTDNVIPQTRAAARHGAQPDARGARSVARSASTQSSRAPRRLYGAKAKLTYRRGYPVLVNHERQTDFAAAVASEIAGKDKVDTDIPPVMGAEDFSFMLNERPGAFIFCRQRRQRRPASPGLQFQRRGDPGRHLVLGEAGGNGAAGLAAKSGHDAAPIESGLPTARQLRCGSADDRRRSWRRLRAAGDEFAGARPRAPRQ